MPSGIPSTGIRRLSFERDPKLSATGRAFFRPKPRLQRLDLHLPELDHTLVALDAVGVLQPKAVLQGDPAGGKFGVLGAVDSLLSVQRHGERRALGCDLIDVPFAAGLRLSLIHISEPTRQAEISYAVFCL